jgi:ABC-type uncharacterized transport system involved in gliding motility auxiliary subunit
MDVTNPKPLNAYFLRGHGEHAPSGADDYGYMKLASVFAQNYIQVQPLTLLATNTVPMDCNLLVIAGPTRTIPEIELEKIDQYLSQGGRLLALFNAQGIDKETGLDRTGLDKVLTKWGISVGTAILHDPDSFIRDWDMVVSEFNKQHPVVNPLLASGLYMVQPRSVGLVKSRTRAADAPKADELAFTGPRTVAGSSRQGERFPVMVAAEKGAVKGVVTERGSSRLIVAGDSIFLANGWIDSAANRDFASYAANWLLDRTQLLEGIGPRPVSEYRVIMTKTQLQAAEWILLGGMPASVLVLGSLVWLRRRH